MTNNEIAALINRRRRQVLIHSILYYKYDDSIITDFTWAKWAKELFDLQNKYPEIAADCVYADAFEDFDPSTGYSLPLDDEWGVSTALKISRYHNEKRG